MAMLTRVFSLFLLPVLLCPFLCHAACYFHPPENWNFYPPETIKGCLEIGFYKKNGVELVSSINLAKEATEESLEEYVKGVKQDHKKERGLTWRDLGSFETKAGKGRLTEITRKTPLGKERLWQFFFVKEKIVYVITCSSPEKEFSKLRETFIEALRSFTYTKDLLEEILQEEKKSSLKNHIDSISTSSEPEKLWKNLEKTLQSEYANLGKHWQFLVLKEYLPKKHKNE